MNILQLICSDNFIAVNKSLIKAVGIEPALLLGELASEAMYWESQDKLEDGYFFSTVENVEEKTTLTAYQQRKALMLLQDKGIVDVISKKGSPPKRYIKIEEDSILKLFDFQNLKNLTFKNEKTELSKLKKLDTNNKEQIKKNEKEIDIIEKTIKEIPYQSEEFRTALKNFLEMRKQKKKPVKTERGLLMLLKKAEELANRDEGTMIQIINQSTANEWLGMYQLKNNYSYSTGSRTIKNGFMTMLEEMEDKTNDEERGCADIGFAEFSLPEHTN